MGIILFAIGIFSVTYAGSMRVSGWMHDSKEKQTMFYILGYLLLVCGILDFIGGILLNQNQIRIYDDHIEGTSVDVNIVPIKKTFSLQYSQINEVQVLNSAALTLGIRIMTGSEKYKLQLKENPQKIVDIINNQIKISHM
jgi:hypothetical protein